MRFSSGCRRPILCAAAVVFVVAVCQGQSNGSLQSEADRAFGAQQGAAVVIRVQDGRILAAHNRAVLARRIATPGSTIKPFVLELLIQKRLVRSDETLLCRRSLTINGKRLNCSHPPELSVFDAEDALAFSCNSYFVATAARLKPGDLEHRFRELGFTRESGLMPEEGDGRLVSATTLAERQLLAIGAAGIQVTPMELASAYLRLARVTQITATPAQRTVVAGLQRSAEHGLAQSARPENYPVAGKTGTASDPGNASTHAWFAGFAPAQKPEVLVVVFVERGRGSIEAAEIARKLFAAYQGSRQ